MPLTWARSGGTTSDRLRPTGERERAGRVRVRDRSGPEQEPVLDLRSVRCELISVTHLFSF